MSKGARLFPNILPSCVAALVALCATAHAKGSAAHSQLLEQPMVYEVRFAYIPESDVSQSDTGADLGSSDFMEADADWAFAYYRSSSFDVDLNLRIRTEIFHDSTAAELPSQVAVAAIDAGWTWKSKILAFQGRVEPGIYSDLEDFSMDMFAVPFSLALIKAFNTELSGIAGAEIRPGFDRAFIPLVGMVWAPSDALRLDLRIPRSKATLFMRNGLNAHLGLDWENTTYDLDDARDKLTMDYYRAYVGVSGKVANQAQITFDVGSVFHRTIEFDDESAPNGADLDLEDAFFLRVGVGAPF